MKAFVCRLQKPRQANKLLYDLTNLSHLSPLKQPGQPLLNSMLPAGVVVGMRPQAPTQQQPKNMPANPLSRVVISNSHMTGVRPQSPSVRLTVSPADF